MFILQTPVPLLPPIPANAPTWVYLAIAFIPVFLILATAVGYSMKRYADGKILELKDRLAKQKRATDELKVIQEKKDATNILYVDDNPNDHILVGRTFKLIGMENKVIYRDSPGSGMAYLRENPKSVLFVLADIKMVSNGYKFLETMKLDDELKRIPVVLITGFPEKDDEITQEIFKKGAIGYLVKPLNIFELLAFLNNQGFTISIER